MVSRGVVALLLAVLAQASANPFGTCDCRCNVPEVKYRETCCPGPVVEQQTVVPRAVTESYLYQEPFRTKQCYQVPAGVTTDVLPRSFETAAVCDTATTTVTLPITDIQTTEQPLCRTTCTTSEYLIQIPIKETTCTSAPLCKQTVRSQDNVLQTVSQKTVCAKDICTQEQITQTPFVDTVCQNYQGAVNKVGTTTTVVPEVFTECVQLPPYKCVKPYVTNGVQDVVIGNPFNGGYLGSDFYPGSYGAGAIVGGFGSCGPEVILPGNAVVGPFGGAAIGGFAGEVDFLNYPYGYPNGVIDGFYGSGFGYGSGYSTLTGPTSIELDTYPASYGFPGAFPGPFPTPCGCGY